MFAFPAAPFESALWAIALLPVVVHLLRVARRRLPGPDLARDRRRHRRDAPGGDSGIIPAPPYLAPSADDDEMIGGSPAHLSPPRGPAGTAVAFRAFAPPSFDDDGKEIPKVDVQGLVAFVRTGKVRQFAPRGSLRRLVIDFREMTLAVYVPKQVKRKKRNDRSASDRRNILLSNNRRPSGIQISTSVRGLSGAKFGGEEDDADDDVEVRDDESWNPRHFESKPASVRRLDDLVSVAAVPPRHGGVLEISSRSAVLGQKPTGTADSERKKSQKDKRYGRKGNGRPRPTPRKKPSLGGTGSEEDETENMQFGSEEHDRRGFGCVEVGSPRESTGDESEIVGSATASSMSERGMMRAEEFAFRTPRDAAEFQRIILALRAAGREISYLYETLEAIPPLEIHPGEGEGTNEATSVFASPGVVLEDAWRCLKEMPSLRKCMQQFQLLSGRPEDEPDALFAWSGNEIPDVEDGRAMLPQTDGRRTLLGLPDFFRLFVPPLSAKGSCAVPCFTPCAKAESSAFESDADVRGGGIERHYHRLRFVSALQRRVSRAALYVRAYASARVISHDGWRLAENVMDESAPSETEAVESYRDDSQNVSNERAPSETGSVKANTGDDDGATNSEPRKSPWTPPPINADHQGYSCVGIFQSPPSNMNPPSCTGKGKAWLQPDADPLDSIPKLRELVERHRFANFFIFSYCNGSSFDLCFLLVRSLPVGVDRAFDDAMQAFSRAAMQERAKSLGVSLQRGPGNGSSATTTTFRAFLIALCQKFTRMAIRFHFRKEYTLLSEFEARHSLHLWHYGGSLQKRDDLPENYTAINSQFRFHTIPTSVAKAVLRSFVFDFDVRLRAFSNSLRPERAIASIGMSNIDLKYRFNKKKCSIRTDGLVNARSNQTDEHCNLEATVDATNNPGLTYRGPDRKNINVVYQLLKSMTVPSRKRALTRGEHNQDNHGEIFSTEKVSSWFTRSDIERYFIACQCDVKSAVVRMVQSAAWRGIMFPVDRRSCRIEMQSAQFFPQGFDKEGNAVFYYRNQLQAPWRNDIHGTVLSILDRLETYFLEAERHRPNVKVTVIAFMGRPGSPVESEHVQLKAKKNGKHRDASDNKRPAVGSESLCSDPRIDAYEAYHTHSNFALLQLLSELVPRHYPGRLARALVVPKKGTKAALLRKLHSSQFRPLVTVVGSLDGLKEYVDGDQLVVFAGGNAKVTSNAFHYVYDHVGSEASLSHGPSQKDAVKE